MKIAVAGMGYVGLSNGVLLAQHNEVWAVDVVAQRVADINARRCPLADKELSEYMTGRRLDLRATTDAAAASSPVMRMAFSGSRPISSASRQTSRAAAGRTYPQMTAGWRYTPEA